MRALAALTLVLLVPTTCLAQRDPFVGALIGFRLALSGTYGDEGPDVLAKLDELETSLASWDQTIEAAERDLRARLPNATPSVALEVHTTLAGLYMERGRLADALAAVDAAAAVDPQRSAFLMFRGLIEEAAGRPEAAIGAFERAVALEPGDPVKAYLLAESRLLTGDADIEAQNEVLMAAGAAGVPPLRFIEVTLVSDRAADWPVFAPAAYADAFALVGQRRYAEAIAAFRALAARDPLVADPVARTAPMVAASASLRQNRIPEAIASLEEAVAASADSSEAHRLLGVAYAAGGREADGVAQLETAIRLAPGDERARLSLGRTLMRASQWQAAEEALRETLDALPESADARWMLADLYDQTGRGQDAIAVLEAARDLPLLAGRGQFLFRLADLYHRHQDYESVTHLLAERVRLDRNNAAVHKDLGLAYKRRGQQSEALLELLTATLLGQQDVETLASIGQLHLDASRYPEAETALRRAVALDPEFAQARFALGQTLVRLGRVDEGKAELAEYQRLRTAAFEQQQEVFTFESLVRDAERRTGEGRDDLAAEIWQQVIAIQPNEPAHRIARAGALSRSGDLEGAVAELERAVTMDAPPSAYRQLASLYQKLGRTEDAARAQATFERRMQQPR